MSGRRWLSVGIGPLAALAASFVLVGTVHAAGAVGTGTAGSCTEAAFDTAFAGGGTVTFNCGPAPVTIPFTTTKHLTADTTINGGGLVTFSGGGTVQLFATSGFDLTLNGLVLRDGHDPDFGGAVFANNASVVIVDSTVMDNSASFGGAVYLLANNSAVHAVVSARSTFVGNEASNEGGAFFVRVTSFDGDTCMFAPGFAEAHVVMVDSTFTDNSAGSGAILWMDASSPDCPDVAQANILYSTFADNSADDLFSLVTNSQNVAAELVANVIGPNEADCAAGTGDFISVGYNVTDDASCFAATATGDQVVADTMLGPLADNGGPTQTMALLAGSAALDLIPFGTADCDELPDDQRGIVRPQGTNCDAGAYEQVVLADTAMAPTGSGPMTPWLVIGFVLAFATLGRGAWRTRSHRR